MNKKILAIDDDVNLLEVIASMLEKNYSVVTITDPSEVISVIEKEYFDLVLTDLKMPKMDGFTLIKKINECGYGTPIVVMSGYAEADNIVHSLRAGAVDFLSKPFSFEEINKCIQRVLFSSEAIKGEDDLVEFIKQQKKEYVIPNRLKYIDPMIKQLTWFLEPMGVIDRKDLKGLKIALSEMLMNAYEHGNLEVTSEEKTEIFKKGDSLLTYLTEKEVSEKYKDRSIFISVEILDNMLIYEIQDDGKGFEHSAKKKYDKEEIFSGHGHGFVIASVYVDEITYNEKGNKVKIIKKLDKE